MEIIKLHPNLITPARGTDGAAGYDLFMPEAGYVYCGSHDKTTLVGLGFAAKVPAGFVALILPRSSSGVKAGVHLGNTVGVIDSDYEGEWKVNIRQHDGINVEWDQGDRMFQFVIVPISTPELQFVEKFSTPSERGEGGFGSTNELGYLPIRTPETPTGFSYIRKNIFEMTAAEQGWHRENKALSEQKRSDPATFLALYAKWFE